jgi:2-dehydro-3-deoxyphosphogluconate aldolase/(4S)-4-hydroxy-2-oxoglutarate aldolase
MENKQILSEILKERLIAILRGGSEEMLEGVTNAMISAGVKFLELTFDQNDADCENSLKKQLKLIDKISKGKICFGAGTVITESQLEVAFDAGAKYIVSPNVDEKIIRRTKDLGLVSIPGALTPSEIVKAWNCGADIVKLFPAISLGVDYIKFVRAPLSNIPLLATGGVSPENMHDFFRAGVAGVGVGITVFPPDLLKQSNWDEIENLAKIHLSAVNSFFNKP